MKRFFALWVVSLVIAGIAGLVVGLIEYLTASIVEKSNSYGTWSCADTLLGGCVSDPVNIFVFYPLSAFGMMIFAYPVFRAIVGSFKVVFSSKEHTGA